MMFYAYNINALYWGGIGLGPFRRIDGQTVVINVAPAKHGRTCRVVASKSHLNEATQAIIDCLGDVSSLKFCRLAEGEADIYPLLAPTCKWDTAVAKSERMLGARSWIFMGPTYIMTSPMCSILPSPLPATQL